MKARLATLVAVLVLVVTLPAQEAVRRFTFDDFSRVKRVAEPQFSPDGSTLAVIISTPNLDENRHMASLHAVNIASGQAQVLVNGEKAIGVSFPRWAPSGRQIAYLAAVPTGGPPKPQIFTVSSQGGEPRQITAAPSGVQHFAWSPDSQTIGFATADEPEKKPGYQRWNDSFDVLINDHFLTTAAVMPTHVWMVPAAGGDMKRLTSGTWTLPVTRPPGSPSSILTWTPDGSSIVFTRSGAGGGLQAVNIAHGATTPLNLSGAHPTYSPDKTMVAFVSGGASVASVTPNGVRGEAAARQLTQAIDRGIARVLWMPDNKSVIVGANDNERVSLWQQPLDGAARKLDTGGVSPNSSFFVDMAISASGAIAFAGTSPARPTELYYMASPDAPVKRLTDANGEIASLPLGKAEVVTFKNEKYEQNAILTYPPDFTPTKKYPMVLLIHGGPRAASLMTFSPAAQLMAAKGWLVLQPNYRGSDNLGGEFQRAIANDAGAGPGRDVMAAVEAVKAKGFVDEARLGVSGWSYGGYMTTWMLGNYPEVWKVGVAGAAVTDRIDQQNFSDGAQGPRGANSPWLSDDAMKREREQSPITYAGKIKAPTLILSNTGDYRVPITQSYKLFHALRDAGVTTRFVAYPIYGHNATDPVRQRDVQERWIGWLERYLNDTTAPGAKAQPVEPFRIIGNIHWVGGEYGSYLITTPAGHILHDTGTAEMHDTIVSSVKKLGYDVKDIKIMISSHAHYDHVQGHPQMQTLTGAQVVALGGDAAALEAGVDNSAGGFEGMRQVHVDRVIKDGDTVTLGGTTLRAVWVPGHTQGATMWMMNVQEGGRSYSVAFRGGEIPNAGVPLFDNPRHPKVIEDTKFTLERLKALQPPDLFLHNHPQNLGRPLSPALPVNPRCITCLDGQAFKEMVVLSEQSFLRRLKDAEAPRKR